MDYHMLIPSACPFYEGHRLLSNHFSSSPSTESPDTKIPPASGIAKKGLRFAPSEIRLKIFSHVFSDAKAHFPLRPWEVPILIDVLKRDRELCEEAKEAYFKSATFYAIWSFNEVGSMASIDRIQKLRIRCTEDFRPHSNLCDEPYVTSKISEHFHCLGRLNPRGPSLSITQILVQAKNVTQLSLIFGPPKDSTKYIENHYNSLLKAVRCITSFPKLESIAIGSVPNFSYLTSAFRILGRGDDEIDFETELAVISRLGALLGLKGQVDYEYGEPESPVCIGLWKAGHGETLVLEKPRLIAFLHIFLRRSWSRDGERSGNGKLALTKPELEMFLGEVEEGGAHYSCQGLIGGIDGEYCELCRAVFDRVGGAF